MEPKSVLKFLGYPNIHVAGVGENDPELDTHHFGISYDRSKLDLSDTTDLI
jgi:hypothetical protein